MTFDPGQPAGQPGGPPVIDLRSRTVWFSSAPRRVLGLLVGLAVLAVVGWLVIGSVFDVPWFVAAPMSVMFGAGFVVWQVTNSWRGYALSAVLWLGGFAWLAWWWVGHNL
jgi:hypothetical protein